MPPRVVPGLGWPEIRPLIADAVRHLGWPESSKNTAVVSRETTPLSFDPAEPAPAEDVEPPPIAPTDTEQVDTEQAGTERADSEQVGPPDDVADRHETCLLYTSRCV